MIFRSTLFCALFAVAIHAQETRGNIDGRVVDPSGAVIPGVEVKAVNSETHVAISGVTNQQGNFEIHYLPPGNYQLIAEFTGFKKYIRTGVELHVDDELSFELALESGQVNESVTVTAASPLLETSVSTGQVADNKRITELPLSGGNAYTLALLSPGVLNYAVSNHPELAPAVEVVSNIGVSGVRDHNSEYSLDGAPSMWGRNASFVPPSDLVQEFKVETTRFDATGRSPGGSINVALRSGGNRIHGTLLETHSDQKFQALDFFQRRALYDPSTGPPTDAKLKSINPAFIINRFSATIGGPVELPKIYHGKNRTFWIYGFEGLARPSQEPGNYYHTVPTVAERQGDFSALLAAGAQYQIYDPASTVPAPNGRYSRQALPGNIIAKSRLDPTALNLLQYWPMPNVTGLNNGENNYFTPLRSYNEYFSHTARVDHTFSERSHMFARYNQAHQLFDSGEVLPTLAEGNHRNRYNKGFGLDEVYIINPQFLVNLRYSLSRFIQTTSPFGLGFDLSAAGFSKSLTSQISSLADTFPQINLDSYQQLGNSQPSGTFTNYHTWGVDFTKVQGRHSLRLGGEFRLYRATNLDYSFQTPALTFSTNWTRGPLDNAAGSPIGQDLAAFLLGLPTSGKGQVNASYAKQSTFTAGFIQDEFKVNGSLTLNFGLRYEYETAPTERYNRSVLGFDFSDANPVQAQAQAIYAQSPIPEIPVSSFKVLGGLSFAGVNGNPSGLWKTSKNDFAPRVALAWRMPHSSVLRVGYGIYYITNGVDRLNVDQTGFTQTTTLVPSLDNGQTFIASLSNPFPSGYQAPTGASAGLATYLGQAVTFFNSSRPPGYAQRWNFSVQKQLPFQILMETAYVGTAASRLDITRQYDPIPAQYLSTSPVRDPTVINFLSAAVANPFYPALSSTGIGGKTIARSQLLRPYPEFTGITSVGSDGYSWYHSLQLRMERRLHNGFTLQGSYTWSKFMEGTAYLNPTDARPEYVISDEDRPQRFTASGIWELPFGTGRALGSHWSIVPRSIVSGWQVQAIYQAQSGGPLTFGDVLCYCNVHDITKPVDQRSTSEWFNTSVFEKASGKALANNIRTFPSRLSDVRGQGVNIWNASAMRYFPIREGIKLQFRAEWLNAMNHSFFALPNVNPTAAAFGSITATNGFPRQIYFALKLMY